jgi:hypothetical protein
MLLNSDSIPRMYEMSDVVFLCFFKLSYMLSTFLLNTFNHIENFFVTSRGYVTDGNTRSR